MCLLHFLDARATMWGGGHVTEKYDLWIRRSSITWELIRNAEPWALSQSYRSRICISTRSLRDLCVIIVFCRAMVGGFQSCCWIKIQITARDCPGMQIRESGLSVAVFGSGSLTSLSPPAVPSISAWAGPARSPCGWHFSRTLPTHSPTKSPLWPCPPRRFSTSVPCWMGATCPGLYCSWPTAMPRPAAMPQTPWNTSSSRTGKARQMEFGAG